MYYETQVINGVLCERFSPKLAFRECSREKITHELQHFQDAYKAALSELEETRKELALAREHIFDLETT